MLLLLAHFFGLTKFCNSPPWLARKSCDAALVKSPARPAQSDSVPLRTLWFFVEIIDEDFARDRGGDGGAVTAAAIDEDC